jgi:hypothetical protein
MECRGPELEAQTASPRSKVKILNADSYIPKRQCSIACYGKYTPCRKPYPLKREVMINNS